MVLLVQPATVAIAAMGALVAGFALPSRAAAQTVSAASQASPVATPQENLIARIALYPDDLVAIILPAATRPLDIVEAERFLEKRKQDPKLAVPAGWDESVKSLLNYPVVVTSMSQDLEWTKALGEAVAADQQGMMAAVQSYRRKVVAAGNLKTDAKQTVVVEKEVVRIVQTDPQVIYVPQYNPVSVMTYGYSSWGYYGSPYPVYYYPYAPGAAIGAGIIWGAAIGAAWSGGRYVSHYGSNNNIQINRGDINIDRGNLGQGNLGQGNLGQGGRPGGGTAWKPGASQTGPIAGNRVGDSQFGNRAGGGMGPQVSNRAGNAGAMGPQASNRAGNAGAMGPQLSNRAGGDRSYGPQIGNTGASSRARSGDFGGGARAGQYGGSRSSAFGGYGNRAATSMSSNRGAMSRGGGRMGGGRRG